MAEFWTGGGVKPTELLTEVERLMEVEPQRVGKSDRGSCVYTQYGFDEHANRVAIRPVCIVGQAVYNLTGKFVAAAFESARIGANHWVLSLGADAEDADFGDPTFSDETELDAHRTVLKYQIRQDSGARWGELNKTV